MSAPSWDSLVYRGSEARKAYQYEEAEKLLEAALRQAEKFDEQDPRLTTTLRELADTYFMRKKFAQSEGLYRRELNILKKLGENYPDIVHDLMGLGRIYKHYGDYSQSNSFFLEALADKERTHAASDGEELMIVWELARSYAYQGQYKEAASYFERGLALRRVCTPKLTELPNELVEVADNYRNDLDFGKAQGLYQRAIVASEKMGEAGQQETAIALARLAKNQTAWGKRAEADEAIARLMVFAKDWPAKHKPAMWLTTLGDQLASLRKYAEARLLFEQALKVKGENALTTAQTATTLFNLVQNYDHEMNYSEAARLAEKAIAFHQGLSKEPSIELASCLRELGYARLVQSDLTHAEPVLLRALAIDKKYADPNSIELGYTVATLALLYYDQGKFEKAIPLYRRALAIYQRQGPELANCPSVALMTAHLASCYFKTRNYLEAEPLYKLAIKLFTQPDRNVAQYLAVCHEYETMLRSTNKIAEANAIAAQAKSIRTKRK
jgi:tetratricopeptide (TPR) repeat protein